MCFILEEAQLKEKGLPVCVTHHIQAKTLRPDDKQLQLRFHGNNERSWIKFIQMILFLVEGVYKFIFLTFLYKFYMEDGL